MRLVTAIGAAWAIGAPIGAWACHSGLVLVPTVDTVGVGQFAVEVQNDGTLPARCADATILNTQFGLGDRAEAGLDLDLSEGAPSRVLLNAKLVAFKGKGRAVALGVSGLGRRLRPVPYVVTAQSVGRLRLHLGGIVAERRAQPFVGIDGAVTRRLTLMGDHTTGAGNATSLGFQYHVRDGVDVLSGVVLPNERKAARFTLHLVMSGPLSS